MSPTPEGHCLNNIGPSLGPATKNATTKNVHLLKSDVCKCLHQGLIPIGAVRSGSSPLATDAF